EGGIEFAGENTRIPKEKGRIRDTLAQTYGSLGIQAVIDGEFSWQTRYGDSTQRWAVLRFYLDGSDPEIILPESDDQKWMIGKVRSRNPTFVNGLGENMEYTTVTMTFHRSQK